MGGEGSQIDFWDVLDDAQETVERWPSWQRNVEADVFYEQDSTPSSAFGTFSPVHGGEGR